MIRHTVFIKKTSIGRGETYWLRTWEGTYSRDSVSRAVDDFARDWAREKCGCCEPLSIMVVSDEVIREFELTWPPGVQVRRVSR